MKKFISTIIAGTIVTTVAIAAPKDIIVGAGATFPYPLYAQWAYTYEQLTEVKVNYQSIGSGGGIKQIKEKTVDFGASDAPLEKAELDEAGLIQFPMVMGGVTPVVNLKEITAGAMRLDGLTLADIFLGKISKWNDPAIQKLNQGLKLPSKSITVVSRADGSGTTWIFTKYLSEVSPEWAAKVGVNKSVSWPVGVGGKGNEGVAAYVQRVDGAIGYVEYAYALQNKMNFLTLQNREGQFVAPNAATFSAAAAYADWTNAPGFYMVLVNQPGKESWPITGATFILIHREQKDAAHAKAMLDYFGWCYKHGSDAALKLDYIPLPANVQTLVQQLWKSQLVTGGKPILH